MLTFKNLLFVGDPHFSSKKPRRRLDNYTQTIFDKFEQVIQLSNQLNAPILVLGDFFNEEDENNLVFLNQLVLLLKKANYPIYSLKGNHDLKEHYLTDDTTFSLLVNMGLIQVIPDFEKLHFELENCTVAIYGVSHSHTIPTSIEREDEDYLFMMTHHNLEFENPYPNSLPLFEVENCDVVLNGHMHHYKKDVIIGDTTWKNPGNIIRQSIDCITHKPSILLFNGDTESFETIELKYADNVFDVRDYQVQASNKTVAVQEMINADVEKEYEFVNVLDQHIQNMSASRLQRTDNKEFITEAIEKLHNEQPIKKEVLDIVNHLFKA
jgi:predicted phosphodiesterase